MRVTYRGYEGEVACGLDKDMYVIVGKNENGDIVTATMEIWTSKHGLATKRVLNFQFGIEMLLNKFMKNIDTMLDAKEADNGIETNPSQGA